ncbi:hypothetical protein K8I28_10140 [bacterium]|nr:hypothetical protein [bacterium]
MSEASKPLSLEKAIKTALEFETKVRDVYNDAYENARDETGKRVFRVLAREEQGHLDYLNSRLQEWQKTGHIVPTKLESILPPREKIEDKVGTLERQMAVEDRGYELEMLEKALKVEKETSGFYKSVVDTMTDEGQEMFAQFLEIEEAHVAIVQAEIDAVSGNGFYFGISEFDMEA